MMKYMEPERTFQQAQLLPVAELTVPERTGPGRTGARTHAPASASRQLGLIGIAQARAALAQAARRAEERAGDKAA